jgi:co-chaperonin GroES (HSP10)
MSMEMKMKNNYLLVQEIEQQERTTASGIIMSVEKYNRKVKIINSGDNKDLKKGDVVLKNMGKGTIVRLDNVEFELIHITDLIAILTEDNG